MWSNEVAGRITDNAARITGLRPGTPVAVGSVDAFVEALSVGVSQPGQVMLMYGSTMVAVQISDHALQGPSLWSNAGLLQGTSNLSGGMSTTGSLTTWVADLTGSYAVREGGKLVLQRPEGKMEFRRIEREPAPKD